VLPAVVAVAAARAGSMLEAWERDPWLAAPVAIGRHMAGQEPAPTLADLLCMTVDILALGLDDEDTFIELVDGTPLAEMLSAPGGIPTAGGLKHPRTREVLGMLATHLDDRNLARRLRRAMGQPTRSSRRKRR